MAWRQIARILTLASGSPAARIRRRFLTRDLLFSQGGRKILFETVNGRGLPYWMNIRTRSYSRVKREQSLSCLAHSVRCIEFVIRGILHGAPLSLRDLPYEPVCNGSYSTAAEYIAVKKTEALSGLCLSHLSLGPVSVRFSGGFTPTLDVSISLFNERRKWRMNELQWRGMRGVGSGTSRLEVEAAWVGGSCPGRRSLCRGDVLYTTERQIASSPTRKPLARSPSLPFLSPPLLFPLYSPSLPILSRSLPSCVSLPFLLLLGSVLLCVRLAVPYPSVAPLSSAHSSFSVHLSVFLRSTVSPARACARVPLATSLSVLVVRPTATWPCYGGVPDTRVDFVNVVVRYVLPRIPVPRLE